LTYITILIINVWRDWFLLSSVDILHTLHFVTVRLTLDQISWYLLIVKLLLLSSLYYFFLFLIHLHLHSFFILLSSRSCIYTVFSSTSHRLVFFVSFFISSYFLFLFLILILLFLLDEQILSHRTSYKTENQSDHFLMLWRLHWRNFCMNILSSTPSTSVICISQYLPLSFV